jgi:hypothetical protein
VRFMAAGIFLTLEEGRNPLGLRLGFGEDLSALGERALRSALRLKWAATRVTAQSAVYHPIRVSASAASCGASRLLLDPVWPRIQRNDSAPFLFCPDPFYRKPAPNGAALALRA